MSIIVTGGAGFIGSSVVRTLNDSGEDGIIIADDIAQTDKWLNLRNKKFRKYIHKTQLLEHLSEINRTGGVQAVIHMGACSSTTERDFDYLYRNNFEYTKTLWDWCAENGVSFIYASSAATYGDGSCGFDDEGDIDLLQPLNGYGYSKQLFDLWVKHQATMFPPQHVGLKFFNVYGPNEYFKGSMASMVYHGYKQIREGGAIRLFKSCNPAYEDGEQLRDFVYIKDVCRVILWLLEHPKVSGLFNVGTGRAQSFRELAEATFRALGREPNIEYISMPGHLREKYQYYTKAEMSKLREAGYDAPFMNVEEGVADYVQSYLDKGFLIY